MGRIMNESRSKRALKNTISAFVGEFASIICGLILPRMILSYFGSAYNGITSSITHFISFITLMKAGIGGVTRAALYKPLAEHDDTTISEVLYETEGYIRKIATIFLAVVFLFASIYPFLFTNEFSWLFTFSLIIIISITTFIEYYFCYARSVLLEADQKIYVWNIALIISTVLNTILSFILIQLGATIHVVKLGSAAAYIVVPLVVYFYTSHNYKIDRYARPKISRLTQRWDALAHEIADFINNNVDVMVLTVFADLKEVSVYTVYAYVTTAIRKVVINSVSSFHAAFGDMYARNEFELMNENLQIYELIVFSITSIIYSVSLVMIAPFAVLYTNGVTDVSYYRPLFGALLVFANAFTCFRIPYNTITTAAGHFKQTKKIAYAEAILNIVISVFGVIKWGIVGVTTGTLAAAIFRSSMYACYMGKNVLPRKFKYYAWHVLVAIAIMGAVWLIGMQFKPNVTSISAWVIKAFGVTLLAIFLTIITDIIFWRNEMLKLMNKLRKLVKK